MSHLNTVYVRNLPWTCTSEQLSAEFSQAGEVAEAKVIMYRDKPSKSRGFGFVTFKTPQSAAQAVAQLNGRAVGGRQLSVEISEPREPRFPRAQGVSDGGGFAERAAARMLTGSWGTPLPGRSCLLRGAPSWSTLSGHLRAYTGSAATHAKPPSVAAQVARAAARLLRRV